MSPWLGSGGVNEFSTYKSEWQVARGEFVLKGNHEKSTRKCRVAKQTADVQCGTLLILVSQ